MYNESADPSTLSSLSVLFKYFTWGEVGMFIAACLASLVHGASRPAISLLFGRVLEILGSADTSAIMDEILFVSYAMVLLSAIIWVAGSIWYYLFTRVGITVSYRIQQTFLEAVMRKDIEWFDRNEASEIPPRLVADVAKIENAVASKAGDFVFGLSQAVCGLALGFSKGWELTLIVCGCVPLIALGRAKLTSSTMSVAFASQTRYAKAGAVAEEVLLSIRTVAAFGQEQREVDRYDKFLGIARKTGEKVATRVGFMTAIMIGSVFVCCGIAIYVGGLFISNDVYNASTNSIYEAGDISVVLSASVMSGLAIGQLSPNYQAFTDGMAALFKLQNIIRAKSEIEADPTLDYSDEDVAHHSVAIIVVNEIKFDQVFFRYPTRPNVTVLSDLSLVIQAGQRVAIVGESGSGKSTIMSLLERFYDPSDGEITINDIDIRRMHPKTLRKLFGYVGQEPVLFATTIRNNLTYGLSEKELPSDERIATVLRMANVEMFVKSLADGLDTHCGPEGSQMSGGQKQRLAIARALLRDAQVLLLDEATSALDNESEKQVQQTIDEIQAKTKLTTISIAHRLSTIRKSDVIFVLRRGGELVEQGTHDELTRKENGLYRSILSSHEKRGSLFSLNLSSFQPKNTKRDYTLVDGDLASLVIQRQSSLEELLVEKPDYSNYNIPFRRILKYTVGDQVMYLPGLFAAFIKGLLYPLNALMFSAVVGYYYLTNTDEMMSKVQMATILYLAFAVLLFGALITVSYAFARIGEGFTMRLRSACFKHIMRQDMGFFDDPWHTPNRLLTSLASWTQWMSVLAGPVAAVLLELVTSLTAGLLIAFLGSPKLTGILMATLPLLVAGMLAAMRGSRVDDNDNSRQAAVVASEAVRNMRTVRALTSETTALSMFDFWGTKRVVEETIKCRKSALIYGFSSALLSVPYSVAFYVGGRMVSNGEITASQVAQVFLGFVFTSAGAGAALSFLPDLDIAKMACHDVFKLLDRESKIDPFVLRSGEIGKADLWEEGSNFEMEWGLGDGTIKFDNVFFAYPQRPDTMILQGLSFEVKAGLKVALVGPSGGGKSTVVSLLLRYYDPIAGRVSIGGTRIKDMDVSSLRSLIGYVGQEPQLFDASMEDNVKYGNPLATAADLERVKELAKLDFVAQDNIQWSTKLGPKGGLLSGGQKQRTAIARALIRDPKLLFLDEATSALDPESESVVQEAIDMASAGRTTFIIAHRLATVENADLILVIAEGKLAERGTHSELMRLNGIYSDLHRKGKH